MQQVEYGRYVKYDKYAGTDKVKLIPARNGKSCKTCRAWQPLQNIDGSARTPRSLNACTLLIRVGDKLEPSDQYGARTKPKQCCEFHMAKGRPLVKNKS